MYIHQLKGEPMGKIEEAIKSLSFVIQWPGFFEAIFTPFTGLINFLASFKIDLSAINVTCLGASAPMEIVINIFIKKWNYEKKHYIFNE